MAIGSRVSGNLKSAAGLFAKVDGGWKKAKFGYVKVNGEWKQFWADKLEDFFSRADTVSGLGTAESGQAWDIVRGQWRINSNNASTTGAKSDVPMALIDAGFLDFSLEANELTPGTGVVLRANDKDNWWAVVPYYNSITTQFTYCAQSHPESYCIKRCEVQTGSSRSCGGELVSWYDYTAVCSVPEVYVPGEVYCAAYECVATPAGRQCQTCERLVWVRGECLKYGGRPLRCLDYDAYQKTEYYQCDCVDTPADVCGDQECIDYQVDEGYYDCPGTTTYIETFAYYTCDSPNGYDDAWVYTPEFSCDPATCRNAGGTAITGIQQVCDRYETGTTTTNYFYLQVIKMEAGTLSVVRDIDVGQRWSAVKISALNTSLTVTAYTDSLYTQVAGTYTTDAFTSAGTKFGVVSKQSLFEDGRTIGSLKVLPLGQ